MLRNWSQRHEPTDAGSLEERVAETFATARVEPVVTEPARRRPVAYWCTATAAAVAMAAACWAYLSPSDNAPIAKPVAAVAFPATVHTRAELIAQERLLVETDRLFDARLAWLAEEGNDVQMGLAEEALDEQEDLPAVAVRLVVVRRDQHEEVWAPVRSIDVITRSEAAVQLPGQHRGLFLWAYVLPDGAIAVDADMAIAESGTLRATTSGVFAPGVSTMVASRHVNGTEYRVFQVASLLTVAKG